MTKSKKEGEELESAGGGLKQEIEIAENKATTAESGSAITNGNADGEAQKVALSSENADKSKNLVTTDNLKDFDWSQVDPAI